MSVQNRCKYKLDVSTKQMQVQKRPETDLKRPKTDVSYVIKETQHMSVQHRCKYKRDASTTQMSVQKRPETDLAYVICIHT